MEAGLWNMDEWDEDDYVPPNRQEVGEDEYMESLDY